MDIDCQKIAETKMRWTKKGLIFSPDKRLPWMQTNAQLPTLDHSGGDLFKIYFASRDAQRRSSIGYFEIDMTDPQKVLNVSEKPVLEFGPSGSFDEHGVLPASVVTFEKKKYLYFTGWKRSDEPGQFYYSIGLAVSEDGGEHYYRYSDGPLMSVNDQEAHLNASPFVFVENGLWKMFYVSGLKWEKTTEGLWPHYHVKYAFSNDGLHWIKDGEVAIHLKNTIERNIARTCIVKEGDLYKAWFSYASVDHLYRIGYGESTDGVHFERMDQLAGIDVSEHGHDSEMMCYPYVLNHGKKTYMFYNGNHFGESGIGLAVHESV